MCLLLGSGLLGSFSPMFLVFFYQIYHCFLFIYSM